ncbi:hypothetical protein [Pontibacter litorisediminis]|uniref:hypothetical protein n=1 Tax=Pontibacter litorisediminis TaxID=1846260 RepID=UPI0023EDC5C1|nr:hypothetical protein [Pontibacter litorisediminis]
MIKFRVNGEELDLEPSTTVQVEYHSSLFDVERIPGMLTYPITLPWSKKNKRLLGFPGQLSVRSYRKEPFACEMYLENLWRVGKLYMLGTSEKGIKVNFQSEVGDLGEGFKNDSLRDLDLGTGSEYALLKVQNDKFPENGSVPYPYLVNILRQVMRQYGYTISGPWLEKESTKALVLYNTQPPAPGQVVYAQHLPDMKVNEFMKAIRAAFGLGYLFNTTTRTMEIVRLKDVIKETAYVDWREKPVLVKEWTPNETDGFKLEFKPVNEQPLAYQVGRGKQAIPINLSTLAMSGDVPVDSAEASYDGKFDLILLTSIPGATPRGQALDPALLYQECHRDWLEFLSVTELIETEVDLNITDLRTLRQDRKVLVYDGQSFIKALWGKVSVSISLQDGIKRAKVPLYKTRI